MHPDAGHRGQRVLYRLSVRGGSHPVGARLCSRALPSMAIIAVARRGVAGGLPHGRHPSPNPDKRTRGIRVEGRPELMAGAPRTRHYLATSHKPRATENYGVGMAIVEIVARVRVSSGRPVERLACHPRLPLVAGLDSERPAVHVWDCEAGQLRELVSVRAESSVYSDAVGWDRPRARDIADREEVREHQALGRCRKVVGCGAGRRDIGHMSSVWRAWPCGILSRCASSPGKCLRPVREQGPRQSSFSLSEAFSADMVTYGTPSRVKGDGARGPRLYDGAAIRQRWTLPRRSIAKPDEVACFPPSSTAASAAPCTSPLPCLPSLEVAHRRPPAWTEHAVNRSR